MNKIAQTPVGAQTYGQSMGYYGALAPNQLGGLLGARALRGFQSPFANAAGGLYLAIQTLGASRGLSARNFAELAQKIGLSPRTVSLVGAVERGRVNTAALNAFSPQKLGEIVSDLNRVGLDKRQAAMFLTTPNMEAHGLFMQHGGTQAALASQHAYVNQRILAPTVRNLLARSGGDPAKANGVLDAFLGFKGRGVRSPQEAEFLARRMGLERGMGANLYGAISSATNNPMLRMVTGGSMHGYLDLVNAQRHARPLMEQARGITDVVDPLIEKYKLNVPMAGRLLDEFVSNKGGGIKDVAGRVLGVVPFEEIGPAYEKIQKIRGITPAPMPRGVYGAGQMAAAGSPVTSDVPPMGARGGIPSATKPVFSGA